MWRAVAGACLVLACAAAEARRPHAGGSGRGAPRLDRGRPPPVGPAPSVHLPAPARFVLPSGARLLVVPRHTLPMAVVALMWPQGASTDPVERAGLAALTANLLDEGAAGRDKLQLLAELQRLGASLESGAGWDTTALILVTLTRHLDPALALLADVALRPSLVPADLERVRAETLAALQQDRDSPAGLARERLDAAVYGAGRRAGLPMLGTPETVVGISAEDVRAAHRRLRMDRCVILVAGDVDAAAMRARFEGLLAGAPAAREPEPPARAPPPPPPPSRRVIDRPGAPQSEVRFGLAGPPRTSPDYFPLLVLNEILGGGDFANRLNLNLREAHAYTYGAHSSFAFRRDGGPFTVVTAARTDVTGATVAEAFGELVRIRAAPVRPDELRFAKDALVRALARRFETLSDVVREMAAKEAFGLPDDYFETFARHVDAVSAGDVQRVARQHLDLARLSIVIVGDRGAIAPQLRRLAAGEFAGLPSEDPTAPPAPSLPTGPPR